jgi:ssDNA-binding Zn-finger/Zn-ribbon topoisomerase 1
VNEKKELLNMLREMWQKGNSPLRRIYSSLEELEANLEIKTEKTTLKEKYALQPCPNCGAQQKITKPLEDFFPYQNCKTCKHPFYVNKDLTARKLTEEEKENMPASWVQIVEDMNKKKLAIAFRLE